MEKPVMRRQFQHQFGSNTANPLNVKIPKWPPPQAPDQNVSSPPVFDSTAVKNSGRSNSNSPHSSKRNSVISELSDDGFVDCLSPAQCMSPLSTSMSSIPDLSEANVKVEAKNGERTSMGKDQERRKSGQESPRSSVSRRGSESGSGVSSRISHMKNIFEVAASDGSSKKMFSFRSSAPRKLNSPFSQSEGKLTNEATQISRDKLKVTRASCSPVRVVEKNEETELKFKSPTKAVASITLKSKGEKETSSGKIIANIDVKTSKGEKLEKNKVKDEKSLESEENVKQPSFHEVKAQITSKKSVIDKKPSQIQAKQDEACGGIKEGKQNKLKDEKFPEQPEKASSVISTSENIDKQTQSKTNVKIETKVTSSQLQINKKEGNKPHKKQEKTENKPNYSNVNQEKNPSEAKVAVSSKNINSDKKENENETKIEAKVLRKNSIEQQQQTIEDKPKNIRSKIQIPKSFSSPSKSNDLRDKLKSFNKPNGSDSKQELKLGKVAQKHGNLDEKLISVGKEPVPTAQDKIKKLVVSDVKKDEEIKAKLEKEKPKEAKPEEKSETSMSKKVDESVNNIFSKSDILGENLTKSKTLSKEEVKQKVDLSEETCSDKLPSPKPSTEPTVEKLNEVSLEKTTTACEKESVVKNEQTSHLSEVSVDKTEDVQLLTESKTVKSSAIKSKEVAFQAGANESGKSPSEVFFRAGGLAQLEDARDDKISGTIIALQARCRGYLSRQKLKKLKLQHLAVCCIQRNVRKLMAIREWPWWRLYTKVKPLLDVHRTEEELKSKDVELELLRSKLEKLEKERNEFKHNVDKLESKLSEMTADFQEEHTTSNHATELLETETALRLKLEKEVKELQTKYSNLQRKHETTELDLMQTRLLVATLDEELDEDEEEGDSVFRQKYERSKRELEFTKKKLEAQHEEELESQATVKKQLERKLFEANADSEEQRKQVQNLKRKAQRLGAEMQDMKLHLEEQVNRNSDLEKKQRKFDSELRKVTENLKDEKTHREKIQRERDELAAEKYTIEQQFKNLKLDFEMETEKSARLEKELHDMSSVGNKDDKEVVHLKRLRAELESKLTEQEEELDDQAGTIQQLEQAKLRLEMASEKLRQQHLKELEEKDQEMEDMRAATQKKVRSIETQLEEEYEEKQKILKDKRELERKIQALGEQKMTPDRDTEKRLRRDLKRTRALLQDAQLMLDKQKEAAGSRGAIKQLRNQLEDAEYATAAAVKARKGVEMEVTDLQQQLEDMSKSKQELDERLMAVSREKNEIQSRVDEHDEDYEELMKKYRAAVAQISTDRITIEAQSRQIEELSQEKEKLVEETATLQSNLEYLQSSTVDKQAIMRMEAKVRDLESRLELEQTAKGRAETQLTRIKEQLEIVSEEKEKIHDAELRHLEETKRANRQLRDTKEELAETQRKEAESSQRKHDLELKVESLESDYEQSQADLRLAFKRIADLQAVIEDELDSDEDSDLLDSDENVDTDTDSEDDDSSFLVNHRSGMSSRLSMASSISGEGGIRRNLASSLNAEHTTDLVNGGATDTSRLAAGDR